jgi:hypothetical protein
METNLGNLRHPAVYNSSLISACESARDTMPSELQKPTIKPNSRLPNKEDLIMPICITASAEIHTNEADAALKNWMR